jgi:hypothetical protein
MARISSRAASSILLGRPPPIRGRSDPIPSALKSRITRRTWFSSVWSTRAISGADDPASEANTICARWRSANTFDWREIRRSFTASSGINSRTNTDAGRATTAPFGPTPQPDHRDLAARPSGGRA